MLRLAIRGQDGKRPEDQLLAIERSDGSIQEHESRGMGDIQVAEARAGDVLIVLRSSKMLTAAVRTIPDHLLTGLRHLPLTQVRVSVKREGQGDARLGITTRLEAPNVVLRRGPSVLNLRAGDVVLEVNEVALGRTPLSLRIDELATNGELGRSCLLTIFRPDDAKSVPPVPPGATGVPASGSQPSRWQRLAQVPTAQMATEAAMRIIVGHWLRQAASTRAQSSPAPRLVTQLSTSSTASTASAAEDRLKASIAPATDYDPFRVVRSFNEDRFRPDRKHPLEDEAAAMGILASHLPPIMSATPGEVAAALLYAKSELKLVFEGLLKHSITTMHVPAERVESLLMKLAIEKVVGSYTETQEAVHTFVTELCRRAQKTSFVWLDLEGSLRAIASSKKFVRPAQELASSHARAAHEDNDAAHRPPGGKRAIASAGSRQIVRSSRLDYHQQLQGVSGHARNRDQYLGQKGVVTITWPTAAMLKPVEVEEDEPLALDESARSPWIAVTTHSTPSTPVRVLETKRPCELPRKLAEEVQKEVEMKLGPSSMPGNVLNAAERLELAMAVTSTSLSADAHDLRLAPTKLGTVSRGSYECTVNKDDSNSRISARRRGRRANEEEKARVWDCSEMRAKENYLERQREEDAEAERKSREVQPKSLAGRASAMVNRASAAVGRRSTAAPSRRSMLRKDEGIDASLAASRRERLDDVGATRVEPDVAPKQRRRSQARDEGDEPKPRRSRELRRLVFRSRFSAEALKSRTRKLYDKMPRLSRQVSYRESVYAVGYMPSVARSTSAAPVARPRLSLRRLRRVS